MPDLKAPLRLTWDVPPDAGTAAAVWARVLEARVLFVELRVRAGRLAGLEAVLGAGAGPGPRVSLLGEAEVLLGVRELLGSGALAGSELKMLPPYGPEPPLGGVAAAHRLVPALWSTPDGLRPLRQAAEIAVAHRLPKVAILNPAAPAPPLRPEDRAAAAQAWRGAGAGGVELEVHDLFLAEELGLAPFAAYAGCQAGGALAHVTAAGRVTACRTLPVDLGNLLASPLREIWASDARVALRRALERAPEECAACVLAAACCGGCRGLAAGIARADASCPGPRSR